MYDLLYVFLCGVSVAFSVCGLARLSAVGINDAWCKGTLALLIVLLIAACTFFGWVLSDVHMKNKKEKEEVAK